MEEAGGDSQTPLLLSSSAHQQPEPVEQPALKRSGNIWTAVAHIITGVVGSGVLSLAWSMAQLGWIAGPVVMLSFALVTVVSTSLLSDSYRSPNPEYSPTRHKEEHKFNFKIVTHIKMALELEKGRKTFKRHKIKPY